MIIEPYTRKDKHYFCGKELLKFPDLKIPLYTLLVADLSEAYCARIYSDGEIEKIFDINSTVPGKHKSGGQSAQRFARIRENEITHWFKRLNEYMKPIEGDIRISCTFIYRGRFEKHLNTYNKEKVVEWTPCEYGGLNGVYQYLNKHEVRDNKSSH